MANTEALIASAKACGLKGEFNSDGCYEIFGDAVHLFPSKSRYYIWDPPENPEQNWMCVKELLRREFDISYGHKNRHVYFRERDQYFETIDCPPEQFAMLAIAEVVKDE